MVTDRETTADVIVIGAGPAGMAAVAAARAAGASVIAVEAMPHIGGNAVWSTGYLAFVGTEVQKQEAIVDSVETFLADSRSIVDPIRESYGIDWDEDITRLFAEESGETYRQLISRGVRFSRIIPRPRQHTVGRMLAVEDTWMLQRAYQPDFETDSVTAYFDSSAKHLIRDGGKVIGAHVATPQGGTDLFARSVVLTTGGYQANPLLRRRYQPQFLAEGPYLGIDTCRGDGHLMGQAVGGDLVNMTFVPPLVIVSSSFVEDSIAVNADGRRFHDEAGPYDERVQALLAQQGRVGWYIYDNRVAQKKSALIAQMPRPAVTADSLPELARLIDVPAEALTSSVADWNTFLSGPGTKDPTFGRVVLPEGRMGIQHAPFGAVPMVVGANFVSGGFTTTRSMQVVDVFGDVISGLYAAGDCAGGLNPIADLGGIRIAGGLTLGRIAGQAAAEGRSSQAHKATAFGAFMPSSVNTKLDIVHIGER